MKKIIFLVLAAFMSSIGIMAREDEWSTPIPKVDIELLPAKRLNYGVIIQGHIKFASPMGLSFQ